MFKKILYPTALQKWYNVNSKSVRKGKNHMNKKRISRLFLLCALLLMPALLVPALAANGQTTPVVYVRDGGTGDGSSAETPLGSLSAAYTALGDAGGTIVIVEKLTLTDHFVEPEHTGTVTVTQAYGDTAYRNETNHGLKVSNHRYFLNGPTEFEHITFRGTGLTGNNFLLFIAQFNPITMGEGIRCEEFGDYSVIARGVSILGGTQNGAEKYASLTDDLDTHITIHSGKFLVVAFSRQVNAQYSGMAHINIYGGTLHNLYLGAANAGQGGDVDLRIHGGEFLGSWISAGSTACYITGDLTVTVNGGDFSNLINADGTVTDGTSSIDLSALADSSALQSKLTGFDTIITQAGTTSNLKPEAVFESGTFTASNGVTIPYRYYLPQDYQTTEKTYPVFLYMHGNGSRGQDNVTQLTTNGAALNTAVLNSEYECIMLAPQCPSASQWVTDYPGSAAFAEQLAAGARQNSAYLDAALELLNHFITTYRADVSRIYVTGSSNGGGATWSMTAWYPEVFAAAVPLAGTGSTGGEAAIASRYTTVPIWTFHGDADTTLSVEGTRKLAAAIKAAGGENITYTEIAGGTHNIWKEAATTDGLVDWIFAQTNEDFKNTLPAGNTTALTTPENLTWNERVAVWSDVPGAVGYKITVYCGETVEVETTVTDNEYAVDFVPLKAGTYAFTVEALSEKQSLNSPVSEKSASYIYNGIRYTDVNNDGKIDLLDALYVLRLCVNEPSDRVNAQDALYILEHILGIRDITK